MHFKIPKKITICHFKVDEIIQEALFKADKEDAQMTALRGFVDLQVIYLIRMITVMTTKISACKI